MKIYDISQEIFTGKVYPGDTAPSFERVRSIRDGDACNVTDIKMCAHNCTHIDAPFHFVDGGKTVDEIDIEKCVGEVTVTDSVKNAVGCRRIILKDIGTLSAEDAEYLVALGVDLVGIESQSVGDEQTHRILLGAGIVILEGLVLDGVKCGKYTISALPIKLGGADGAPCRAVLIGD